MRVPSYAVPAAPQRPFPHLLRPVACACILAGALSAPAFAQDAKPAEPAKLESITVTAERRAENIKDVPSSISTIKGEMLDVLNSSGQDVRLLAGRVPSLNIESSFGRAFPRFYIRGFGNTDFDLNASQPVSLVFDDVVQENPILKGFPLFDIEQIEVLRGPQGTLFGRNSPAGVIKFDSAKPQKKFEAYANLSYGRLGTSSVEGAINVPLSPVVSLRFSGQLQHRDDWVHNTIAGAPTPALEGYSDNAGRIQLLYAPSADTSALFNVHARDLSGSARLFRANIIRAGSNELVAGFDPAKIAIDGRNQQDLTSTGGSLRIKHRIGDVTINSITGYEHVKSLSRGDIDGGYGAVFLPSGGGPGVIPFPAESADGLPKHRQLTQELRAESSYKGPLNWLVGLYYFDEDITIDSYNYDTFAAGAMNGFAQQQQRNKAWAAFGSLNYALSDRLKLRGGLRYTNDKKDFTAQRFVSPIGGGTTAVLRANPSANDVSWDLSGTYALSPETNVYARIAKGFRAPSIQGRLLFGDTLSMADAETVTSYEAGIKSDLFNRRARVAFNVFHYAVKDQQLTAVGGQTNFNRLINADKATGQGFELDAQAYLSDQLLVTVGASLNATKIRDGNLAIAACGSGCTVLDPAGSASGTYLINGNALPQAPKTVLNATARYGIPLANGGEIYLHTDWAYRSKINFFLYESREYTGKQLLEGGVRAGYIWGNGKYEAAVFGRNITNQIRVVGGIDFNNLTGFINEPRMWGAQFRATF